MHDGWQIALILNGNGSVKERLLWGTHQDELLAQGEKFMLNDHLNTVRDVISADGKVMSHYDYNAFGKCLSPLNGLSFAYTGKMIDTATNLQWNINRWYDSSVGRWISEDPIGFEAGDGNLYRYVNNRITLLSDYLGYKWSVPMYFYWYYTGGGQTVTLGFTGLLDDYLLATAVTRLTAIKNSVNNLFKLDCNNKLQVASGTVKKILTTVGGGLFDPLTVLGTSEYNATYTCSSRLTCDCCNNKITPKKQNLSCNVIFHFNDRFANPLDWNGLYYERDEELYKSCRQNCKDRYQCPFFAWTMSDRAKRLRCIVERDKCLKNCNLLHPRSEWYGAYPYDIIETFSDKYEWENILNTCQ